MDENSLIEAAAEARKRAYTPYSKFQVGAALLLKSGEIVSGCNIENASFGATVCAERVAILKAKSENPRAEIEAIAVVTGGASPAPPCALCLQVIAEFCGPETPVLLANTEGARMSYRFKELLPHPFSDF